ncbi:MAG TPA: cytochrome-c peroxidase [Geminicoccaceae bacterium]|nr:cytochrome-c peroxidase [Geminicoccaceae bacterium]
MPPERRRASGRASGNPPAFRRVAGIPSPRPADRTTSPKGTLLDEREGVRCNVSSPCSPARCSWRWAVPLSRRTICSRPLFEPIPEQPPELPGLQATPERVELGKMLYFETRLSESHTISCNSCHMVGLGGVDMLETSIGHRWQMGARNSPTVLNAVFNSAQFWDGRAKDLEEQAGGPLENPVEMATTHAHVIETLRAIPGYVELFAKAFPDDPDPVNIENVTDAIALFEATLITPNAPFDRYLRGDADALTPEQKEGLQIFVDTAVRAAIAASISAAISISPSASSNCRAPSSCRPATRGGSRSPNR